MEAMIRQFPTRGLGKDESSRGIHEDTSNSSPTTDCFVNTQLDTIDVCTTQLSFPAQLNSWNGFLEWPHNNSALVNERGPYPDASYAGTTEIWTPAFTDCRTDGSASLESQSFDLGPSNGIQNVAGSEYLSQPKHDVRSPQMSNQHTYLSTTALPILGNAKYPIISSFGDGLPNSLDSDWMCFTPRKSITSHPASDTTSNFIPSKISRISQTVDWSASSQAISDNPISSNALATPMPKRKHASPGPPVKKSRPSTSQTELAEYVGVFENAPGALATVKTRKKLDGAVRKAAQDVRKAGACHQCRFRKRTCSTSTPCNSCLKNGRGLHELKCQRESPFVGKSIHSYFEHSSNKRYLTFGITLPPLSAESSEVCYVTIDGVGRLSHTVKLRAYAKPLDCFSAEEATAIRKTKVTNKKITDKVDAALSILLLEDHETLGTQVEQWAVEYTTKFVHDAGPKFYPTTAAALLGTAYVKKGLPESPLVAAMLRAASISFVLRAGVKCTSSDSESTSDFRTIQASIDTILYQRLKLAEKDLYKMLQRIVFRSLGYLAREQIYPVALVCWQLLRMLCISSGHLSNIVQRFQATSSEHADLQYHSLTLLLSTHFALFRSSSPLLLDFRDKPNQDLLGGDEELIELGMRMRQVVLDFKEKGVRDMKGSIAYRKEHFDIFRKVYEGF